MKKSKRPFELEEDDSSEEVVGIGLDDDIDEEVIDLDDVVDLDEEIIGDVKEFDLDVDLLDADSDLNLNDLDSNIDSRVDAGLAGDILKEFEFPDQDLSSTGAGDELDFAVDDKVQPPQVQISSEEEISIDDEDVPESLVTCEDLMPAAEKAAEKAQIAPVALDAVIEQMESRLVEVIRETVESRLPDIVKSLLQEEIRRLKEEIK